MNFDKQNKGDMMYSRVVNNYWKSVKDTTQRVKVTPSSKYQAKISSILKQKKMKQILRIQ